MTTTHTIFRRATSVKFREPDANEIEINEMVQTDPDTWFPTSIENFHTARLRLYCVKKNWTLEKAIVFLMQYNKKCPQDYAQHVSRVIGADHTRYEIMLMNLGENKLFIR